MLTENDRYAIQTFQNLVQQCRDQVDLASLRSLRQTFQKEIQPIQSDEYRIHSVLVEINKQMRLLNLDATFLQTARQPETIQTRSGQLRDRLKLLLNYCEAILTQADSENV